jgi:hypothetical protein
MRIAYGNVSQPPTGARTKLLRHSRPRPRAVYHEDHHGFLVVGGGGGVTGRGGGEETVVVERDTTGAEVAGRDVTGDGTGLV